MKPQTKFILLSAVALILILVLECINKRFWLNDFKVYYSAADAFRHGLPVYNVPFGEDTGLYKYAPALLYVFAPYTVLPYFVAAVVHYLFICFATVSLIILVNRLSVALCGKQLQYPFLLMFLALLAVMNHLFRELHLGNVNVILVWMLVMALNNMLHHKVIVAGFLFALACLFKPYFLILVVPLILFRKAKTVLWSLVAVAIYILLAAVFTGFSQSLFMYKAWWSSMQDHSVFLDSCQTINFLMYKYLNISFSSNLLLPAIILALWGLTLFAVAGFKLPEKTDNNKYLAFSFFSLLAFIPNLVITDTEHFLFSLPLIIFCMYLLALIKNKYLSVFFILSVLIYGVNSPEFFGNELSDDLEHHGMLGIGNLLIITCACIIFTKWLHANSVKTKKDIIST